MVKIREKAHYEQDDNINASSWLMHLEKKQLGIDIEPLKRCLTKLESLHNHQAMQQALKMADVLIHLHLDENTITTAFIYPYVDFSILSLEKVESLFDTEVVKKIRGIQKMASISSLTTLSDKVNTQHEQMDNIRKMLVAMVEDVSIVFVKLAEQLTRLRDLKHLNESERLMTAQMCHDIYAPLANRLGVGQLKWEMEDLSFRYLSPDVYKKIANLLDEKRLAREIYIKDFIDLLNTKLTAENIKAKISGRVKHIYSIWRKMQKKDLPYDKLYDIRAVRILVPSLKECYQALGIVHQAWQHIASEFDDYIAHPKENGYQSLHTAIVGPKGKTVEVQIRTHEMHQAAELGVASHWRYKEAVKHDGLFEQKIAWLRQLIEWQTEITDKRTNANIGEEIFKERIYVFTPKGRVIELPEGATALDFAYHIHTQVGHRCRGAKVGGKLVQLTQPLKTGSQVEVLTANNGKPSRDWLNPHLGYLKTARARHKAHAWFKAQDKEIHLAEGKETIEKECQKLGIKKLNLEKLAHHFNMKTAEQVITAIGSSDLRFSQLLHAANIRLQTPKKNTGITVKAKKSAKPPGIRISGVGNLLTQIANCCKPVPGDAIIGYITQGKGVTIHRQDCTNLSQRHMQQEERLIDVSWGEKQNEQFSVDVVLVAYNRHDLIRDVGNLLAAEKLNVLGMSSNFTEDDNTLQIKLTLEISSLSALSTLLDKIKQLPNVISVNRQVS